MDTRKIEKNLKMEDSTDPDYKHATGLCKGFENLRENHDLYGQCDTFLLANVF